MEVLRLEKTSKDIKSTPKFSASCTHLNTPRGGTCEEETPPSPGSVPGWEQLTAADSGQPLALINHCQGPGRGWDGHGAGIGLCLRTEGGI